MTASARPVRSALAPARMHRPVCRSRRSLGSSGASRSHKDSYRAELERAAARLPLFVTEFGTVTYTGGGAVDAASSTAWLNLLDRLKMSYANWTYSDADEGSAAFRPGTCYGSTYAGTGVLTESGVLMRERIRTPDSFPTS